MRTEITSQQWKLTKVKINHDQTKHLTEVLECHDCPETYPHSCVVCLTNCQDAPRTRPQPECSVVSLGGGMWRNGRTLVGDNLTKSTIGHGWTRYANRSQQSMCETHINYPDWSTAIGMYRRYDQLYWEKLRTREKCLDFRTYWNSSWDFIMSIFFNV